MASLVIKNLPEDLHAKLKARATQQHRSMTREAILLLETALREERVSEVPPPYKGRVPLTRELIERGRQSGRS
ncbi:MAG: Arc family DNA-binding protein [Gammaproteobacteria bacterium]|nr:Arc family DNA-binding protein [Gammaproteobacteria bacterium]